MICRATYYRRTCAEAGHIQYTVLVTSEKRNNEEIPVCETFSVLVALERVDHRQFWLQSKNSDLIQTTMTNLEQNILFGITDNRIRWMAI